MKKITLLAAFLVAGFSYGQTTSGFVVNPSFEDGLVGDIAGGATLNDWKLGGGRRLADGVSASIQTANVHAEDGSNALEVSSNSSGTGKEWDIRLINTTYPFAGNNTEPIEVTVTFWAKTTDADTGSEVASGDMRLLVKDTGSLDYATADQKTQGFVDKTHRVLLTSDTWVPITKTFTFDAAADYSLSLYFEFGKVDGVTQIDGITTSVTGGASLATEDIVKDDSSVFIYPNPAMNVLNYKAEGVKNIEVYNLLGQKLKAEKAAGSLNTSTFSKGSYILKLMRENGAVSTKRFVKE
jgi:hypothetical protein